MSVNLNIVCGTVVKVLTEFLETVTAILNALAMGQGKA